MKKLLLQLLAEDFRIQRQHKNQLHFYNADDILKESKNIFSGAR